MKLVEIIIKPLSSFGTPLKGDTIFGHFFWQLIYDPALVAGSLERLRDTYGHTPFVIFSSAFPRLKDGWLLPRPTLPLHYFKREKERDRFEALKQRKEEKKKCWMLVKRPEIKLDEARFLNEEEAAKEAISSWGLTVEETKKLIITQAQAHNTINRLTFTTGEGFAPNQLKNFWFLPGLRLSLFALYSEEVLSPKAIRTAFLRMGETGFGRDASSGLGRFTVEDIQELNPPAPATTLYTLGPYVPQKGEYERLWYKPFVRFGRLGSALVLTQRPFKNPVLMADEGAVLKSSSPRGPYVGRALSGLSKAEKMTIGQGFSIVFPLGGLA